MFSPTVRRAFGRMSTSTVVAPYTRAVVSAMRKLYPEALADHSFDNTGLLLEAPFDPVRRQMNAVLLTVDLTKAVADEAIERKDAVIIAYHPIIFRGLKRLALNNSQQQSLLRLAAEGISVYSPHTAIDCARGGLGDWLADIVTGTPADPEEAKEIDESQLNGSTSKEAVSTDAEIDGEPPIPPPGTTDRPTYMLQHHPSQLSLREKALLLGSGEHKRYPIRATTVPGHPGAGMGRIVRLAEPVTLTEIIDRIGLGLGNPKGFPIAIPQGKQASEMQIRSIAICAGSGSSVFAELDAMDEERVDLLFTGELSHHEALAAIERGQCVITLFHSNTERGFLHSVLKGQLEVAIKDEWERVRNEERARDGASEEFYDALNDDHVEVQVSEVDRDPYGIMISKAEL